MVLFICALSINAHKLQSMAANRDLKPLDVGSGLIILMCTHRILTNGSASTCRQILEDNKESATNQSSTILADAKSN